MPIIQWVGQSAERGHAIRDAALDRDKIAERIRARVVVVGGGVAGSAAVWRLARAGFDDVILLELEPEVGGTARSGQTDRKAYPMGAHYLPSPHSSFRGLHTLLESLDVIIGRDDEGRPDYDPRWVCRSPVERHRHRGMWHEGIYPSSGQSAEEERQWTSWIDHLAGLDERRGSDGRRLFDLPVARSSFELRHLDHISMAAYLDGLGLDSWRLRWTVDYACRDDYGCTAAETSAFAGLHHFLARGLEDRHERPILTWPEGNARLVLGMLEQAELGDRLRNDTAVLFVDPDEGRVLARDFGAERTIELRAEVIVWAAPRFVLGRVLPQGRDPLAPGTLTYAPWLVANVEVSAPPGGIGAPLAWDNVGVEQDDLGYVVATHTENLVEGNVPGAVLTYYRPLLASDAEGLAARRQELLAASAEATGRSVMEALEGLHPGIGPTIERIDIARWGHGMVRPVPGLLFGETLARAAAPIGRILPCASDVRGLPLFEEAFSGGVAAAEAALHRLGRFASTLL